MAIEHAHRYGWRSRAISLLAGCVIWEIGARLFANPFLPTCSATIAALAQMIRSGLILSSLTISLTNLVIGFAAAALVGIAVGAAMGRARQVDAIVEPYLHALLAAPGIIYVPLLFTFFGAARVTQIGSVFLHAMFVIAATTAGALKPRNATLIAMATAFGASDRQIFWRVRWPEARPLIASGLRVGALLAVKGMINGEMFIAFTGLGALVRTYGSRFQPDRVLAILIVIVAVSLVSAALVDQLERRAIEASA